MLKLAIILVDHPRTRFVSFTGSREVGTRIYERAAKVNEGQIWLKRVIAEMGGKDTIVVDNEADLELSCTINRKICIRISADRNVQHVHVQLFMKMFMIKL